MTGIDLDADPTDPANGMGIIPRAVSTIFANARTQRDAKAGGWKYSVKGSFIEIYNEELIDLLSDGSGREVHIREDKNGHIIWDGLREMNVKNAAEVMEYAFFFPLWRFWFCDASDAFLLDSCARVVHSVGRAKRT